ncbi:MAG: hypothetical protein E6H42_08960 [Betaproteobacteria bacterium]|nr:MAG: hypothetical protein E6H42_08960 [Betaproteobacteria bacterium]
MARPPEAARARSPEAARARSPEAARARSPEAARGRSPEAARGRSPEAARTIARAPGTGRPLTQARARSRCRATASCAILHRASGAVVLAQRQGEAERAALAVAA